MTRRPGLAAIVCLFLAPPLLLSAALADEPTASPTPTPTPTTSPSSTPTATTTPEWEPLRVYVDCDGLESASCVLVLRLVEHAAPLRLTPRANAQVELHLYATPVGPDQRFLFRFTSNLPGVPPTYEVTAIVGTRDTALEQIAELREPLFRGLAPYLGALHPDAVHVELTAPRGLRLPDPSSPWDFQLAAGGSWERAQGAESGQYSGSVLVARTTRTSRFQLRLAGGVWAQRTAPDQPVVRQHDLGVDGLTAYTLTPHVSVGVLARERTAELDGQPADHAVSAAGGVSFDAFAADDPRGNQLSATFLGGARSDWSTGSPVSVNESAQLLVLGSVRFDHATVGVLVTAAADDFRDSTTYVFLFAPSVAVALTPRVDLRLDAHASKVFEPAGTLLANPNQDDWDLGSSLALVYHLDRGNQVSNNRFSAVSAPGLSAL